MCCDGYFVLHSEKLFITLCACSIFPFHGIVIFRFSLYRFSVDHEALFDLLPPFLAYSLNKGGVHNQIVKLETECSVPQIMTT